MYVFFKLIDRVISNLISRDIIVSKIYLWIENYQLILKLLKLLYFSNFLDNPMRFCFNVTLKKQKYTLLWAFCMFLNCSFLTKKYGMNFLLQSFYMQSSFFEVASIFLNFQKVLSFFFISKFSTGISNSDSGVSLWRVIWYRH